MARMTPSAPLPETLLAIQQATRTHQQQHACNAHTFEDGIGLWQLVQQHQPRRMLEFGTGLGYTACLMALASPQGQVLTVLLNSPDRFGETTLLMDYYYANFYGYELKLTDNQLNRYQDADGAWHTLYIRDAYTDLLTPTSLNQMHLYRRLDETPTNPQPDVAVGALEVYRGHELVTSVPLYAR